MSSDPDLLAIDRGLIVAPAGCGKTQSIVTALTCHRETKPILVLTHTNAGVAALRQRLSNSGVNRSAYRLATIDGWALRLICSFPGRAGFGSGKIPAQPNYVQIRKKAWQLLKAGHVTSIIRASYSRLIVDEYQDCSLNQHAIVYCLSQILPSVALGDPLQAIFGFSSDDPLASWQDHVLKLFPPAGELNIPHRSRHVGNEELGHWLLSIRPRLQSGQGVDLATAPRCVRHSPLSGDGDDHRLLVEAAHCRHRRPDEKSLVIGHSKVAESRYKIARAVPGMVTIEPVDLKSVVEFAKRLELGDGHEVSDTLSFASEVITYVEGDTLLARITSLDAGTARKPANDVERAALALKRTPSYGAVSDLLSALSAQSGSRMYRPAILRAAYRALKAANDGSASFVDAALRVREENRAVGRQIPSHAIGSTLLVKGLEADHVALLTADDLDPENLYVALTRGSKSVVVCSSRVHLGTIK